MKRPATNHARRKAASSRKAPEIKVTRNSARPQIKASRGPGGPVKRRKVAQPAGRRSEDSRVAETRRQSLSSIGAAPRAKRPPAPKRPPAAKRPQRTPQPTSSSRRSAGGGGGGSVRAVAVGAGGSAAARVVAEVARPVGAVTRPMLRVVSGGLEALPQAAGRATPVARGRLLILLAGVLAAGLIYINVGKLEYGDGYGKYSARSQQLQRENTALRSRIANLNAAERIQEYAKRQGMTVPKPEQYKYLRSRRGDALKASRGLTAPLSAARPGDSAPSVETGSSGAVTSTPVEPVEPAATPEPGL
ncbi:MAG: hypothetical protein JHC95_19875 [Solirubrobacteraceae bacterium]|nr:hypothetical protein [Solirubrobacteraceae bacterium]